MDLERLPDHVLIKIFQSLGNFDLLVCRTVCKRWLRLIRSKKYFTRVHKLSFSQCIISSSCPPLSVFRNCEEPFFRFLSIEQVKLKKNEDITSWEACWQRIGAYITHLTLEPFDKYSANVDPSVVLGNGSAWSELVNLDVYDCRFTVPTELRMPNLVNLRLGLGVVRKINESDFQTIFPNVTNVYIEAYFEGINTWVMDRLKKISCWSDQLPAIPNTSIEELGLNIDDFVHENRLENVQPFLDRQQCLKKFSLICSYIMVPQWTQLTDLDLTFREPHDGQYQFLLRDCLVSLRNLNSLKVTLEDNPFSDNHPCLFGHQPVDLPHLKHLSLKVSGGCELCWENSFKSFKSAKTVEMHLTDMACKYVHLATQLESLSFVEFFMAGPIVHDTEEWIFSKMPSLLELDCSHVRFGDAAYKNAAKTFPNLRSLEVARFRPCILECFPALEYLSINFINPDDIKEHESDGCENLVETIGRLGKNLRVLEIEGILEIKPDVFKQLFAKLDLLLKVQYDTRVFTRHMFEAFDI